MEVACLPVIAPAMGLIRLYKGKIKNLPNMVDSLDKHWLPLSSKRTVLVIRRGASSEWIVTQVRLGPAISGGVRLFNIAGVFHGVESLCTGAIRVLFLVAVRLKLRRRIEGHHATVAQMAAIHSSRQMLRRSLLL
jgi:hypothetical protein